MGIRSGRRDMAPAGGRSVSKRRRSVRASFEGLERRLALSGLVPNVEMISVATADSQSVTVDYRVENAPLTESLVVAIDRASGPEFQPGDRQVGALTVDANGPDGSVGEHRVVIPIAGGLPPDPAAPYVLAVADPAGAAAETTRSVDTASFRTHVIGVVVHGGIQDSKSAPAWEFKLARELKGVGYDQVIAFNWAAQSNTPGQAAKQGPRLANLVRKASESFPASDPVDVHLIGHSEGAVVVSQALLSLQHRSTPQLQAGYLKVTLLDPHAANNHAPGGQQVSFAPGLVGGFARWMITSYQARAHDPLVVIPANVDDAEVYYQHTQVSWNKTNHGVYNLWGQVPVKGQAQYSELTGPRVAHSGGGGVQVWYSFHVVPTLRDGGNTFVNPTRLTAEPVGTNGFTGTAAPGASVLVFARRLDGRGNVRLGQAVADGGGDWSVASRPLPAGAYRVLARVEVPEGLPSPRAHLFHTTAVGGGVVRGA